MEQAFYTAYKQENPWYTEPDSFFCALGERRAD